MTEYKIILTDCDGVLLDWETAFHEWMAQKGYNRVMTGVYEVAHSYGMEKQDSKKLVREFNDSAWMGYLKAFRDARSGVAHLYEQGYRFHCITSLSLDKKARRLRIQNLENVFGKGVFKEVICLDTGADKDEALELYRDSGLYWIEDKEENANLGAKLGLKSILLEHAHNSDANIVDGVTRASKWDDIVKLIVNN